MDKNKPNTMHLTAEQFQHGLTQTDLDHISVCDPCAELFADYMEIQPLLTAPRDLRDSVLRRSHQIDIQVISKTNHASKQLQLFCYSLRVGFAVLGALALLALTPYSSVLLSSDFTLRLPDAHLRELPEPVNPLRREAQDIATDLNTFFKWR